MIKKALVVGGSNGIGLAIALELLRQGAKVTVVDRVAPDAAACAMVDSLSFCQENLLNDDVSFLEEYKDIDMLMITAGFGRVAKFETIVPAENWQQLSGKHGVPFQDYPFLLRQDVGR